MMKPEMRERYASRVREELLALAEHDTQPITAASSNSQSRVRVVVAIVIALALIVPASVFALTSRPASAPAEKQSTSASASQALQLVPTVWRVQDAAGESPNTWIIFDTAISLIRPKGDVFLSWSTQGDALLTYVDGWSMSLGTSKPPTVPWLTSTARFVRDGDGWELLNAAGLRTARLVHDGTPPPSKQALHEVPKIAGTLREQHTDSIPGRTVQPMARRAAEGTWGLPGVPVDKGSLTLRSDGTWTARTSCDVLGVAQGGAGAYRTLPSGFVLVTESGIAGTGCVGPDTGPPSDADSILEFSMAGSIAIGGDQMTVYDRSGKKLGALERKG